MKEVKMITEKQKEFIKNLLKDRVVCEYEIFHAETYERQFKNRVVDLTKNIEDFTCYEASVFIDMLLHECETKNTVAKREENLAKGKEKYEKLLQFAKDNNVKGIRNFLRKDTIIKKCKDSGVEIPQELL